MIEVEVSGGVAHGLPDDLRAALRAQASLLELWEALASLARNR